jgi:hypothetical protein
LPPDSPAKQCERALATVSSGGKQKGYQRRRDVPKRKSRPVTNESSGGGEALQPEIAAAAIQKVQLIIYASKKNLRTDRISIFGVAPLKMKF